VLVIAEDHRNLAPMLRPEAQGGWGLDAVWADDFHHQVRRGLAGDHEGYYQDFSGRSEDLAETLRRGWFYRGQFSAYRGEPRGTDPAGIVPRRFVICLENHDQVGNRALGERLHHQIDLAAYRAATALLLCAPESPLLFMGQEWAAGTPFRFFTDHEPRMGRLVTEGRRREFKGFSAFSDPRARERIPNPQDEATFRRSRLDWTEPEREPHASTLRLHRALLALRRTEPLLREASWDGFDAAALGEDALALRRVRGAAALLVVARLRGAGPVAALPPGEGEWRWASLLDTEDPAFCPDPRPAGLGLAGAGPEVTFSRPGAVILEGSRKS
jgi:maltooligosyltrehalose trehalohydrolase